MHKNPADILYNSIFNHLKNNTNQKYKKNYTSDKNNLIQILALN